MRAPGRRRPQRDGAGTPRIRGERPFVFTNIGAGAGVQEVVDFISAVGGLA
jgi:Ni2+-binding GTPase involved in maturation of urease and hydrogenase